MVEVSKAKWYDYIRFIGSALLLLFSTVVTFYAIIERKTGFWHSVPGYVGLIIFIIDLFWLGIVEGLQIALVELKRQHPDSYKKSHPGAYKLGQIAARGDNVERFLMGRQVFVVFLVFFSAKLTTILLEDGEAFLFPVPVWFRVGFLETGILACIVIVIIAQLMPQIVAAKYPVHFLQFYIMWPAYYMCIFVELTGLTHICWVLSALLSKIFGMKDDDFVKHQNKIAGIGNADDILNNLDNSLKKVKVEDGSERDSGVAVISEKSSFDDKKITTRGSDGMLLDVSVTPMGQAQFSRFSTLVETINQEVDPATLTLLRHFLNNHPEKFAQFPTVVGSKLYPSPQSIADTIIKEQGAAEVPKFLTDISDPEHVPPHIVACELLAQNRMLRQQLAATKQMEATRTTKDIKTKL